MVPLFHPEAPIHPVNLRLQVQVRGWWCSRAWRGTARASWRGRHAREVMRQPSCAGPMSNRSCNSPQNGNRCFCRQFRVSEHPKLPTNRERQARKPDVSPTGTAAAAAIAIAALRRQPGPATV